VAGDGCSACVVEPVCGDRVLDHITGEQCDDGNTVDGDGCSATCKLENVRTIAASWSFEDLASGQPTGCPTGFDTVAVIAQPAGPEPQIVDTFSCATMTGTTRRMAAGRYGVHLAVGTASGTPVYAQSTPRVVDLTVANGAYSAVVFNDAGYFDLQWTLRGAVTSNVLTCAQAGVVDLAIVAGGVTSILPCGDGTGMTSAVLAGTYTVTVTARDAQQQAIAGAPSLTNQVIAAPNQVTPLGSITISIALL